MSRALFVLDTPIDRGNAAALVSKAPPGTRVEFKGPRRSLPQNDKLWAMLTEVARQGTLNGERFTTYDWKDIFTVSLRQARVIDGIDPGSKVSLGLRTSDMSKEEMGNLLELIAAWGAQNGVVFKDEAA